MALHEVFGANRVFVLSNQKESVLSELSNYAAALCSRNIYPYIKPRELQ